MPLTDVAVRQAKPDADGRRRKLLDADGLFLEISPGGAKRWTFRYRIDGRRPSVSLGAYPKVSLREARTARDDAARMVRDGMDPAGERRAVAVEERASTEHTFAAVAARWLERQTTWTPGHRRTVLQRLDLNLLPYLAARRLDELTAPEILDVLRWIEDRGAIETAHRCLTIVGQVFAFAIAEGIVLANPARDLTPALRPVQERHLPAITDAGEFAALLRAIEGFRGTVIVKTALRLLPLVFTRFGELRQAEWAEFDLDADAGPTWTIPAARMKGRAGRRRDHVVPLAPQAVAVIESLRPLTGAGRYVFPSARSPLSSMDQRPMSENAVRAALISLGYDGRHCAHGFRASARTILDEVLGEPVPAIEAQLAHAVEDSLGRAYNRTERMTERRKMMFRWANWCDAARVPNVVPLRAVSA